MKVATIINPKIVEEYFTETSNGGYTIKPEFRNSLFTVVTREEEVFYGAAEEMVTVDALESLKVVRARNE